MLPPDHLLARLSAPRSSRIADLRLVIAARSLAIQIGYLQGDAMVKTAHDSTPTPAGVRRAEK